MQVFSPEGNPDSILKAGYEESISASTSSLILRGIGEYPTPPGLSDCPWCELSEPRTGVAGLIQGERFT